MICLILKPFVKVLRACPSSILKDLVFTISKTNFITYNTPLYNIPYIKTSIFLTLHLNIISLLIFYSFSLYLSFLCVSLSQPSATSHHIHPPKATSKATKSKNHKITTKTQNHLNQPTPSTQSHLINQRTQPLKSRTHQNQSKPLKLKTHQYQIAKPTHQTTVETYHKPS